MFPVQYSPGKYEKVFFDLAIQRKNTDKNDEDLCLRIFTACATLK